MAIKGKKKQLCTEECYYVLEQLERICTSKSEVEALIGNSEAYTTFCRKEDATSYLINLMRKRITAEIQTTS